MSNIKSIPGTDKFMDTETLKVYNDVKCEIDLTEMLMINDEMALIEVAGVPVKKPLIWFKHLAMLGLVLPKQFKYEINNIEFKNYKPFGISKDYNIMPVFKEYVVFNVDNVDYRLIARYPMYGISCDGIVYNLKYNMVMKNYYSPIFKYKTISLPDTYRGKNVSLMIHKLVAMAWCDNKDYYKYNIVDHKDDNKLNNHYTNLNWTNNNGNQAKLTHGNYKANILVRNIKTNQVKKFSSLTLAAEFIGRSRINTQHTPLTMGRIWSGTNGEFEIQYEDGFKAWSKDMVHVDDKRIEVIDGDERIMFKNMSEIKQHYDLPKRIDSFKKVISRLKQRNKDITINVHVGNRDPRNLEAKNIVTGKIITRPNVLQLAIAAGISKSTVDKYISKNIDNRLIGDWLVRTRTNLPWADELNNIESNKNASKRIRAKSDNEEIVFKSIREAGRFFNRDGKTIKNLASNNSSTVLDGITYNLDYI